jgi:hypothetical protein
MSSRSRMMGAGNASSSVYHTNVNMNTFGGNKKQGITSRVGLDNWSNTAVQTYSNGYGNDKLVCMNQLGGVGAGKSMFNGRFTQVDGTHCAEIVTPIPPVPPSPPTPYPYTVFSNQYAFIWYPSPYLQFDTGFNVTIVVNSASNAKFEVTQHSTPTYDPSSFAIITPTLVSNSTVSYNLPPSLPGKYLSLQLYAELPGGFNIQSFKINGVEQLPNIPYICP